MFDSVVFKSGFEREFLAAWDSSVNLVRGALCRENAEAVLRQIRDADDSASIHSAAGIRCAYASALGGKEEDAEDWYWEALNWSETGRLQAADGKKRNAVFCFDRAIRCLRARVEGQDAFSR